MNISNAEDDSNVSKDVEGSVATTETDIEMKNFQRQQNESNASAEVKVTFSNTSATEEIAVGELKNNVVRKKAELHAEFKVGVCLKRVVALLQPLMLK